MENEHDRKEDEHEIQEKLTSILLALLMTLGLSVTAFAAGETGSITIENAVVGQTYTIYQILELESYNKDTGAYSYKATADWEAFIKSDGIKDVYVEVNDEGYVTWKGATTDDRIQAFAKLAQAEATKAGSTITATKSMTATDTTVKFDNFELGWYLVDSTLGTLCSLDTTNPDVTMEEKNEVPENKKEVQEDSNNKYGETNDADIGQTVNFKSTIKLPKGSENVVFHDTMSAGLTLTNNSIKVYTDADLKTELATSNYVVKTPGLETNCTFEISFTKDYLDSLAADTMLYVGYAAVLNEKAVVGEPGNPNTSKLEYDDKSNTKYTPDSQTKTYTWDVDVFKYTKDGDKEKPLPGAKFTLSKDVSGQPRIALISESNNVYRVAKAGETNTITEITTDVTGEFTIKGLDSDTYYLTETQNPAGYNKLKDPITIVIDEDGKVYVDGAENAVATVEVENKTGTELPSTGGIGTTIFYVVGAILVVGAGVLLVVKKRMKDEA